MFRKLGSPWRRDALRTNLWLVPTLEVIAAVGLFAVTYAIDQAAYRGDVTLPDWVNNGSADAGRQILIGIAAAVITVVGLVFSITIVALTLASTQFGPRMLRNFIRDRGTQLTLGTFVATFVYAVLALGSISHGDRGDFVPTSRSRWRCSACAGIDLGVLIYFIHHVAKSIQLPEVIASIARGPFRRAIEAEGEVTASDAVSQLEAGPTVSELQRRIDETGADDPRRRRPATSSSWPTTTLVGIAADGDAVIRLLHRPGHFVVEGLPLADGLAGGGSRGSRAATRTRALHRPHRTLAQDLSFAIDQLGRDRDPGVVACDQRHLQRADLHRLAQRRPVQDLGSLESEPHSPRRSGQRARDRRQRAVHRFVERAFDKIRQSARGMPAVMIRQLDALDEDAAVHHQRRSAPRVARIRPR